jgi:hypothetical protein
MAIGNKAQAGPVRATPAPIAAPVHHVPATPPIEIVGMQGVAPSMIASLPDMASGADVYARQFYRSSRVPYRRYLPIRSQ